MTEKSTWGGARQGAGAKPKGSVPRVTFGCRINPDTAGIIQRIADEIGISKGEVIDLWAKKESRLSRVAAGTNR